MNSCGIFAASGDFYGDLHRTWADQAAIHDGGARDPPATPRHCRRPSPGSLVANEDEDVRGDAQRD